MRNLLIMCFAALAASVASAATVKTATQPWVEAKIADAANATLSAAQSAASAAISAATNGLVTASVTNGLASAASVSAAVASATNGLASQSSLTSLSSRVDAKRDKIDLAVYGADGKAAADTLAKTSDLTTAGVLNSNGQSGIPLSTRLSFIENGMETIYKAGGVNFWNGREVYDLFFPTDKDNNGKYTIATTEDIPTAVADLSDAGDYLKTADLAANETDPQFANWRSLTAIAAGSGAVSGLGGVAIGCSAKAANGMKGQYGTAVGYAATSYANYGVAIGSGSSVKSGGIQGVAIGGGTVTSEYAIVIGDNTKSFGDYSFGLNTPAPSHFYFAATNAATARTLQSYLDERATTNDLAAVEASIPVISATDATFSNAVLQVGIGTLGIMTNDLQVVHDLAELPVGTSITAVGGLLAALAAGLAALKKKTDDIKSSVDSANAALEEVA